LFGKAVKLRIPMDVVKELFGSRGFSVSKGIDEVLAGYSERVEEDALGKILWL